MMKGATKAVHSGRVAKPPRAKRPAEKRFYYVTAAFVNQVGRLDLGPLAATLLANASVRFCCTTTGPGQVSGAELEAGARTKIPSDNRAAFHLASMTVLEVSQRQHAQIEAQLAAPTGEYLDDKSNILLLPLAK
jgi:hypothetical protein